MGYTPDGSNTGRSDITATDDPDASNAHGRDGSNAHGRDAQDAEPSTYRRRTVLGGIGAGATLIGANGETDGSVRGADDTQAVRSSDGHSTLDESSEEWWNPPDVSEAHVAVLSGLQAGVRTNATGCVHVTRTDEYSLLFDLVLEDIQCVTQAHVHAGGRGEDGPVVAPLLQYTEELDGSGDGHPLTTRRDTPLIAGDTVEDAELVEEILADPGSFYVSVHTVHNPGGEIRGQIRGFDRGQETDIEPEPARFTVRVLRPRATRVVRGDSFEVSARIRNDGDIKATQSIRLRVNDVVVAERDLELDCRTSSTVRFTDIDTEHLDPGEYRYVVSSDDDSRGGRLRVLKPPKFLVSDLDPREATVTQGDRLDVSATIENVGEVPGTKAVEFRLDDDTVHEREVDLDDAESKTVVFEDIETGELDPAQYAHGIFTEDDSDTGTILVQSPPSFSVSDLEPSAVTVTRGDSIDVSAMIENVGEATGTKSVELRIAGEQIDAVELTLAGGESESVPFDTIATDGFEPGEYEHGIFTEDDSETGLLTIEAPVEEPADDENGDGENGDDANGDEENGEDENGENGDDANGDEENGEDENGDEANGDETNGEDENGENGENGDDAN